MLHITTLIDNFGHPYQPSLVSEHGLSFWIKFHDCRILCDMGASALFAQNAAQLGIDLATAHWALLSHGHNDHSGGLRTFLEQNAEAPVHLSPQVFQQHYFSSRHANKRNISTDGELHQSYFERFRFHTESCWITPEVALVHNTHFDHPCPIGNRFLTQEVGGEERLDDFKHEFSLAMLTPQGLVVVSSCSHNGALNILESCTEFTGERRVRAFVGGLHFVDSPKVESEARLFLDEKNRLYPDTEFCIGHCTGPLSRPFLQTDPKVRFFHTGTTVTF